MYDIGNRLAGDGSIPDGFITNDPDILGLFICQGGGLAIFKFQFLRIGLEHP